MRLIGLAVVLSLTVVPTPLGGGEAQQSQTMARVGILGIGPAIRIVASKRRTP